MILVPIMTCLVIALVDDDGLFSDLNPSWSYSSQGLTNRELTDNYSLVSLNDLTQGRFRIILNGYHNSDNGDINLTVTDDDGF